MIYLTSPYNVTNEILNRLDRNLLTPKATHHYTTNGYKVVSIETPRPNTFTIAAIRDNVLIAGLSAYRRSDHQVWLTTFTYVHTDERGQGLITSLMKLFIELKGQLISNSHQSEGTKQTYLKFLTDPIYKVYIINIRTNELTEYTPEQESMVWSGDSNIRLLIKKAEEISTPVVE